MTVPMPFVAQAGPFGMRSRKHIAPFALARPRSVAEACAEMASSPHARFMAGGLDLVDAMKLGARYEKIIALDGLTELHAIRREGASVFIGALATHEDIASSEVLASALPDLPRIWRGLANPRIRHAGTIGGNIVAGASHYDAAPACFALGAKALLIDADGRRHIVHFADIGGYPGALLEGVTFHVGEGLRLLADRSLHPMLSVYLAAGHGLEGLSALRLAIGCAFTRPLVIDLPVAAIDGIQLRSAAADIAQEVARTVPEPMGDALASSPYRRRMIGVLTRRLLIALAGDAS